MHMALHLSWSYIPEFLNGWGLSVIFGRIAKNVHWCVLLTRLCLLYALKLNGFRTIMPSGLLKFLQKRVCLCSLKR